MSITRKLDCVAPDKKQVYIYTLANSKGVTVDITNFGGVIININVPDRNGKFADVNLGFDKVEGYYAKGPHFGALIGRHANRIENGEFELNGVKYTLAKNNGNNHLHGGLVGFDVVTWDSEIIKDSDLDVLKLTYFSKDMEEGYPGNLNVTVLYTLTEENELKIEYKAVSDKDTVINLTNHAYFNLAGHNSGSVLEHELYVNADKYTVNNDECLPTGEIKDVAGTPFDFRAIKSVGRDLSDEDKPHYVNGYDHNFVLNTKGDLNKLAAMLYEPNSGRAMEVYTTKPGVQIYTANFLDIPNGKGGAKYTYKSGICLETQFFPNAMKHTHFPSPILRAGEQYNHTTIYKFLVK